MCWFISIFVPSRTRMKFYIKHKLRLQMSFRCWLYDARHSIENAFSSLSSNDSRYASTMMIPPFQTHIIFEEKSNRKALSTTIAISSKFIFYRNQFESITYDEENHRLHPAFFKMDTIYTLLNRDWIWMAQTMCAFEFEIHNDINKSIPMHNSCKCDLEWPERRELKFKAHQSNGDSRSHRIRSNLRL